MARAGGPKMIFVPLTARSGYAVELRTHAGNDEAVCRLGVLIYKVDADVDTGMGPVRVYDSHPDSGGCTRSPNVQAELSDAPFTPGETFKDHKRNIQVTVSPPTPTGDYRVLVTRR